MASCCLPVSIFHILIVLSDLEARREPSGKNEILVDVVAAGLHTRVRSQANGSHYTSTDELPLIPGIDGVGRLPDGQLVYFVAPDTSFGT